MKYGTFSFIVIFLIFEQSYSFNFNRKSAVPFLKQEIEPLDLVPEPSSRFSNFKLNVSLVNVYWKWIYFIDNFLEIKWIMGRGWMPVSERKPFRGQINIRRGVLFTTGFWETNQLSPDKGLAILNNMNIWSFILSVLKNARNRSYRQMSITNNMEILKEKLINALIIQRQLQVKFFNPSWTTKNGNYLLEREGLGCHAVGIKSWIGSINKPVSVPFTGQYQKEFLMLRNIRKFIVHWICMV